MPVIASRRTFASLEKKKNNKDIKRLCRRQTCTILSVVSLNPSMNAPVVVFLLTCKQSKMTQDLLLFHLNMMMEQLLPEDPMSLVIDTSICLVMFIIARKVHYSKPLRIGFRFNDKLIQKPVILPLAVSFNTVIYGSSLGALFVIFIINCLACQQVDKLYFKYLFGWLCLCNINVFVKRFVGRPRPNFLCMNQWKPTKDDKTKDNLFSEDHQLPKPLTKVDKVMAIESRKSFFSGHAVLSMYASAFIVIYMQQTAGGTTLTMLGMTSVTVIGIYPGLTQWKNYWHHWDDVVTGYILAIAAAYMSYFATYS